MKKVVLYSLFLPALAYDLVLHMAGVVWDGFWETVELVLYGERQ